MKISTRHIGAYSGNPAKILEVTFHGNGATITEDILDFKTGKVDEDIIFSLKELINELEEHNEKIEEQLLIN